MATTQKRKAVSKTRKRTITIEDEVLSLASSPMTKTVKPKKKSVTKAKVKKTTAKTVAKKTTTAKKSVTKKSTAKSKIATATKKVSAKKPTIKKPAAKKAPAKKTVAKKSTKVSTARTIRTRKPLTIRETIAAEVRAIETETKQIAKSPAVHAMVRFSELYVLSVLITVIILATVAWTQTLLNIL